MAVLTMETSAIRAVKQRWIQRNDIVAGIRFLAHVKDCGKILKLWKFFSSFASQVVPIDNIKFPYTFFSTIKERITLNEHLPSIFIKWMRSSFISEAIKYYSIECKKINRRG